MTNVGSIGGSNNVSTVNGGDQGFTESLKGKSNAQLGDMLTSGNLSDDQEKTVAAELQGRLHLNSSQNTPAPAPAQNANAIGGSCDDGGDDELSKLLKKIMGGQKLTPGESKRLGELTHQQDASGDTAGQSAPATADIRG